ncbi:membrane protein [Salmonella enterica subsp. enterica]|uniref:Membrane protein n=1 Tax=Salmonella enterica I TaxID=59201 RepID=A0A379WRL3_SALET|nr:membrane protein [Salmonella enterica subsp. enterica]
MAARPRSASQARVWLILAIVLVVGVRWWLKRRGKAEAR